MMNTGSIALLPYSLLSLCCIYMPQKTHHLKFVYCWQACCGGVWSVKSGEPQNNILFDTEANHLDLTLMCAW